MVALVQEQYTSDHRHRIESDATYGGRSTT
jgi:hypothetical protein